MIQKEWTYTIQLENFLFWQLQFFIAHPPSQRNVYALKHDHSHSPFKKTINYSIQTLANMQPTNHSYQWKGWWELVWRHLTTRVSLCSWTSRFALPASQSRFIPQLCTRIWQFDNRHWTGLYNHKMNDSYNNHRYLTPTQYKII